MKEYDLIIIGGGAAGIFAAISAKRNYPDHSVAIIDRTFALGRKLLVCGAGRCNLTNINLAKDLNHRYYGAPISFIQSIFDQFGYNEIIGFFKELGVETYVERKTDIGKIFPITDQAKTITAILERELKLLGVDVFLNTEVFGITKENDRFTLLTKGVKLTERIEKEMKIKSNEQELSFKSRFLIISAGGKSYPALGSNGSGYDLVKTLGHKVIEVVPSALPLNLKSNIFKGISGQKLDLRASSLIDGKLIKESVDDVMFTDYGLSGPAIFNLSREISIELNRTDSQKRKCEVSLNFFPDNNKEEVVEILNDRWLKRPNLNLIDSFIGLFPNKVCEFLAKYIGYSDHIVKNLNELEKEKIINTLTNLKVEVESTRSWNEAEFSAGGIDAREIKEKTLESKIIPGLYFAGEIVDVDGDVGGFNLSWAFSSGHVAGLLS